MADSGALRQRRYKAHSQGDHRLRRHAPLSLAVVPAGDEPGPVDPVARLRALAARLEGVHRAEPGNVPAARELRLTLAALMALPGEEPADPLDELRAMMNG
jgi:hypothetical protein